jgi:hypothetical protein
LRADCAWTSTPAASVRIRAIRRRRIESGRIRQVHSTHNPLVAQFEIREKCENTQFEMPTIYNRKPDGKWRNACPICPI